MTTEDSAQNVPLSVQLIPLKNAYKEGISLLKDTLDVVWKLAPALLFLPGLYLWLYLKTIGWTSLFYESAMTGSGLFFFALAAIVMAVSAIGLFVLPSFMMIAMVHLSGYKERVPKAIPGLYAIVWISWIVVIFVTVLFGTDQPWIIMVASIVPATTYGLFQLDRLEINQVGRYVFIKSFGRVLLLTFVAMVGVACSILPIMYCLQVAAQFRDMEDWLQWIVFGTCLIFSGISLFPGFLYIATRTNDVDWRKSMKNTFGGVLLVAYLVAIAAAFLDPISSMILRSIGIYNNDPVTFQLIQPDLKNVVSAVGLSVKQDFGMNFVTAHVRFNMANTRLLCRDSFDPASATSGARAAARKLKQGDPGKIGGLHCAPVNASEIREIRS